MEMETEAEATGNRDLVGVRRNRTELMADECDSFEEPAVSESLNDTQTKTVLASKSSSAGETSPFLPKDTTSRLDEDSLPNKDSETSNEWTSFQKSGNIVHFKGQSTSSSIDDNKVKGERAKQIKFERKRKKTSQEKVGSQMYSGDRSNLINTPEQAKQNHEAFHDHTNVNPPCSQSDHQYEREVAQNSGSAGLTAALENKAPQRSRSWQNQSDSVRMSVGHNQSQHPAADKQGLAHYDSISDRDSENDPDANAAITDLTTSRRTQVCSAEKGTVRFNDVSTQTNEFAEGRYDSEEDQEMFHDIPDIDDLMSDMVVEEFIPWFNRNNIADDNKSDLSELPEPEDFRENQWSLRNSRGAKVSSFGCYYEGDVDNKKMHGHGRLILKDRCQFIEGKWDSDRLIELNFAQLTHDVRNQTIFIVKQANTYLITICEEKFVARAASSSFRNLNFAAQTAVIKSSLFKVFTILDVIEDEVRSQREIALKKFESSLRQTASEDADPVSRAAILILMSRHSKQRDAGKVLAAIEREPCVSESLRAAAKNLHLIENSLLNRKLDVFKFSDEIEKRKYLDLREVMFKTYSQRIAEHRQMLINKCPNALYSMLPAIESFPPDKVLYVTKEDVGVFEQLASLSNSEQYMEFFEWLIQEFVKKVRSVEAHMPPVEVIPVMFPVYGFLFKSFSETISDIRSAADGCNVADMLKSKSGNWRLKENIKWTDDELPQNKKQKMMSFFKVSKKKITLSRKLLEVQYRFIFKMLMAFSPGNFKKSQKFEYNFRVLEKERNTSWWQKGWKLIKEATGWEKRSKDSPDERLVWLYILDHVVHELFKDDHQNDRSGEIDGNIIDLYAPLLEGHLSFVVNSKSDCFESFRVLTHSILYFIVSTAPYFKDAKGKPGIDAEILGLQMVTITTASDEMDRDPSAFISFKDLVAEYNRYWGLRLFLAGDKTTGFLSLRVKEVTQKFMKIVAISLKKPASIPILVEYFRALNDFFDDFKDINFTTCWFVKSDFYDSGVMEKVDNKLSSGVNCSYRVVDVEGYVKALGSRPAPEHCILLIVSALLDCIEKCLEQAGHAEAAHCTQIQSTGILMDAIRRSLIYLKDQPDYVDFDTFRKESVDPFLRIVIEHSAHRITLSEFKKRSEIIKESFWYIRKMDELGIEQALEKLKSVNSCDISNELLDCYNLYLKKYNFYIENYNSFLSEGKSHLKSLEYVVQGIERPEGIHFSNWTKTFKNEKIPLILAGLSAVWSILVSKDVSSTGKFLKPHCIQLLCVMRLLSVEQPKEPSNHLAQVLTGQGKSVILGLLSSTLALTGHKVRVLCYSDYLSSRDQNDFEEFFKLFQINSLINYGTFEDMANGFLNPKCNGIRTSLRKLVEDRVLNHRDVSLGSVNAESENTVLLIDEVDVFFTRQFYGNVYSSCTIPKIAGLAEIQEKMWGIAKGSKYEVSEVLRLTEKFIDDGVKSGNTACREFNTFRYKPRQQPLTLLVDDPDGNLQIKEFTNRSLMEEHLLEMAQMALWVGNAKENDWCTDGFRINEKGMISRRNHTGRYVTNSLTGYMNTFNYFRLKGFDFEHKDLNNYGYLVLKTGEISYARLPSQFKLILGVSGTLKDLSDYEKTSIQSYKINNFSILPSFFGESNLKFDPSSDFLYLNEEQDWLKSIYDKANGIVKSFRAVLVFFDTETSLNLFSGEYKVKFDRFNEITENTMEKTRDAYVNEAGLSCAVTLATRGMGRGVDYKSSLAVEKNGGIHVIQTFYSVDVKEETQIKGRTARKDNKGSYELVLCREHLVKENVIKKDDSVSHSYSSLHGIRTELMNARGRGDSERIEKSERNHRITMDFYGLS